MRYDHKKQNTQQQKTKIKIKMPPLSDFSVDIISSSIAGLIARVCCHPIDTVKVCTPMI